MNLPTLALWAVAFLGAVPFEADAQTRPSLSKEEPGPGSGPQEGTGSNPTQSPPSIDRNRPVPSTKESGDNKSYGRETEPDGHSIEQGNSSP